MSELTYKDISGYFGYGALYEEVIKNIPDGSTLVEIGSFRGRSTSYLLELANKSGKNLNIIIVDHFKGSAEHNKKDYYPEFLENMNNLKYPYKYSVIKDDSSVASTQVSDNSVDFVMIDASHDYESVKKDILCWRPKVKSGGILSGDDYDWEEVKKAVDEVVESPTIFPRTGGDCQFDIYAGNYWVKII